MYCVQPYGIKRQRLVATGAIVYHDANAALEAGRRLARHRVGVVVLSQTVDLPSGRRDRPQVLAIHGQVPASWRDLAESFDAA